MSINDVSNVAGSIGPSAAQVHEAVAGEWPAEVDLVMSALEAGRSRLSLDRRSPRNTYRAVARLRLFNEPTGMPPWILYTRDASSRSLGFLTRHRLPLGYGGTVEIPGPGDAPVIAHCTLFRCREAAPGWYEGALSFNRDQWVFATGDE